MRFFLLALLLLNVLPAQAEVFKWFDAEGKIQYGDKPPAGVKAKPVSGGVMVVPAFVPQSEPPPAAAAVPAASVESKGPAGGAISLPTSSTTSSEAASASNSAQEAMRKRMLEACQSNRGSDCEAEVDAQLGGLSATVYVPVPIPGWSKPAIKPRRNTKPAASQSAPVRPHKEPAAGAKQASAQKFKADENLGGAAKRP